MQTKIRYLFAILLLGLIGPGVVAAAEPEAAPSWQDKRGPERFAPLDWLVGEWQGYGRSGEKTNYVHKRYEYDVGDVFLTERTISTFPPPEATTEYEVHQDLTVFYRDNATGEFRAKGFYVESFVSSSRVAVTEEGAKIVVETTEVDNGPPGMRTRYTITRQDADRYQGAFEVAMPGKDFVCLQNLSMRRVK